MNEHKITFTATSRIPLDLRSYTGKYDITINAEKTGPGSASIVIDELNSRSTSTSNAVFYSNADRVQAADYTQTLMGGKIYYMHMYYNVNSSNDPRTLTINSITFNKNRDEFYDVDSHFSC